MFYTYVTYNAIKDKYVVGVTINLKRRKKILDNIFPGSKIVYFEEFETSEEATRYENELLDLPKNLLQELVKEINPMLVELIK